MIIPRLLKPGDVIGIVATARKINEGDLDLAIQIFQSWGLKVLLGEHLYSRKEAYLAGTGAERTEDMQRMIDDPHVTAIVAARGGYGTTQILDDLNLEPLLKHPKWIVGFSDITALHLALFRKGVASIHGPMPLLFSKRNAQPSIESLGRLLMNGESTLRASGSKHNRPGEADGIVIGGNLSLIADALGTDSEPDTDGRILVIEEIDEYLYKVDRLMTQLRRAGKLANLKALLVGHMTDLKDAELSYGKVYQEIIMNVVGQYNYPVAFNVPCGHDQPNIAFVHGGHAVVRIDSSESVIQFDPLKEIVQ